MLMKVRMVRKRTNGNIFGMEASSRTENKRSKVTKWWRRCVTIFQIQERDVTVGKTSWRWETRGVGSEKEKAVEEVVEEHQQNKTRRREGLRLRRVLKQEG